MTLHRMYCYKNYGCNQKEMWRHKFTHTLFIKAPQLKYTVVKKIK